MPFQVYKILLESGNIDRRTAAALLNVFVSGIITYEDEQLLYSMI